MDPSSHPRLERPVMTSFEHRSGSVEAYRNGFRSREAGLEVNGPADIKTTNNSSPLKNQHWTLTFILKLPVDNEEGAT